MDRKEAPVGDTHRMHDALDAFLGRRWREIEISLHRWSLDHVGATVRDGEQQGRDPLVIVQPPSGDITVKANAAIYAGSFVSVSERWSSEPTTESRSAQGMQLTRYSYHFQKGAMAIRWDYDPEKHPEMPYHFHPAHNPRTNEGKSWASCSQVDLSQALSAGVAWFHGAEVGASYLDDLDEDVDGLVASAHQDEEPAGAF